MLFGRSHLDLLAEEFKVRRNLHGSISNVRFDLRCDGLSPDDWECPALVSGSNVRSRHFHIAGDVDDPTPTLLERTGGEMARAGVAEAEEHGCDVLFSGDRVIAKRAEFIGRDQFDPLTHVADREAVVLHLVVERATGVTDALRPIYLRRRGRLADVDDQWATIERLAHRAADSDIPEAEIERLNELLASVIQARRSIEQTLATVEEDVGPLASLFSPAVTLGHLVNVAVLYGYRHGRAEAAAAMEPLARRSVSRSKQAQDAGRKRRNPDRVEFAENYLAEVDPDATAYKIAKAYCNMPEHHGEDMNSVERSIRTYLSQRALD